MLLWELGFVFTLEVSIHGFFTCCVVVVYFTQIHISPACASLFNIVPVSVTIIEIRIVFDNIVKGWSIVFSWEFVLLLCWLGGYP